MQGFTSTSEYAVVVPVSAPKTSTSGESSNGEGHVKQSASWFTVGLLQINSVIGVGLLAIGGAFAQLGWVLGLVFSFISVAMCVYLSLLQWQAQNAFPEGDSQRKMAQLIFKSRLFSWFVAFMLYSLLFFLCGGYLLAIEKTLKATFHGYADLCNYTWGFITLAILVPGLFIRNLSGLKHLVRLSCLFIYSAATRGANYCLAPRSSAQGAFGGPWQQEPALDKGPGNIFHFTMFAGTTRTCRCAAIATRGGFYLGRCRKFSSMSNADLLGEWAGMGARGDVVDLETVKVQEEDGGVVNIKLNREKKYNAFSMQQFVDLERAFGYVESLAGDVRCVTLSGTGGHFCAGIDVSVLGSLLELVEHEKCESVKRERLGKVIHRLQRVISLPASCHVPVIAVCGGYCIGAGVDLISACDIRLCSSDAQFSVKEVDLAIVADLGTLQRLPNIVGEQRARELAFTGRTFSGSEAKDIGLVLECLADTNELDKRSKEMSRSISKKSPVTIRGIKQVMNYSAEHTADEGLEFVARWNAAHLLSDDLKSAVDAVSKNMRKK